VKTAVIIIPTECAYVLQHRRSDEPDGKVRVIGEDNSIIAPHGEGLGDLVGDIKILLDHFCKLRTGKICNTSAVFVYFPVNVQLVVVELTKDRQNGLWMLIQLFSKELFVFFADWTILQVFRNLLVRSEEADSCILGNGAFEASEEHSITLNGDAVVVGCDIFVVPSDDEGRDDQQEDGKHYGQHVPLVFDLDEDLGQSNAHPE
jgi:hypothetical protein